MTNAQQARAFEDRLLGRIWWKATPAHVRKYAALESTRWLWNGSSAWYLKTYDLHKTLHPADFHPERMDAQKDRYVRIEDPR